MLVTKELAEIMSVIRVISASEADISAWTSLGGSRAERCYCMVIR